MMDATLSELATLPERKAHRFASLAEAKATLALIDRLLEPLPEEPMCRIQRFYLDVPELGVPRRDEAGAL
jgi:hypothetical protein